MIHLTYAHYEKGDIVMEEIFKILTDYPAYRVSNLGRVQSRWQKKNIHSDLNIEDKWKDLKATSDGKRYLSVALCDGHNKPKTFRIHNLVTLAFLGEKPKGKVVRHIDGNPSNNNINNLTYGTHLENEHDKKNNGTFNLRYGGAKLTQAEVLEIKKEGKNIKQKDLANQYGVSRPTITRILNNTTWRFL
jgi:predicted RNA-binding protein